MNQSTAASGSTLFQQAGALVQLTRGPLTKDLVWKNNVTEPDGMDGETDEAGCGHGRGCQDVRGR